MHVIRPETLEAFWTTHPSAEGPLRAWLDTVLEARWDRADEVKATYATAIIVGKRRVVFNVSGNKDRLVAKVSYRTKVVFVRFIRTHDEYDEIDVTTV